jgi:tetratricopeptide (TPR) repeat protein
LLSIAVDVQGPEVVAPLVKKHKVAFPVVVDSADAFGAAFGLKAIPISFLVDEVGIIRLRGGGPSPDFLEQVEQILKEPRSNVRAATQQGAAALSLDARRELAARHPEDGAARLALAQALEQSGDLAAALTESRAAARLRPTDAMAAFTQGLVLLRQGQRNVALTQFKRARDLDRGNWRIRKQIWALEHPDKFYGAQGIDWDWQKEQSARDGLK